MNRQRKRMFRSSISPARGVSLMDLRTLAKNEPEAFVGKIEGLAEAGKMRLSDCRDLRALYRHLADVKVPVSMTDLSGAQRAISASAFPILTGTLAIAQINEAYAAVPTIGEQLVTEIEDDNRVTTIAAVHTLDSEKDEVKELEDFPEIGTDEEKVEIRHRKNGRRLSISAEAIRENRIADTSGRVDALGEIAGEHVEELTLNRVTDHTGSAASGAEPYAYRPEGTGTALFSATANTPGTRAPNGTRIENNGLVDETDLDAARERLADMRNARGRRISLRWSEVIALVPYALIGGLSKLQNSEYVPGVEGEVSNYGPRGMWHVPPERRITSPKLDDLSTSAWYLGDFKRQFKRKWKMRFEYVTLGQDTQAYLQSQLAFQARIAWDVEVGAVDYVHVVQCLSGVTAPADE